MGTLTEHMTPWARLSDECSSSPTNIIRTARAAMAVSSCKHVDNQSLAYIDEYFRSLCYQLNDKSKNDDSGDSK